MKKIIALTCVLALSATMASAGTQLIKPSGLSVVKGWNFDTAGAGGVDSGASATDWSTATLASEGWVITKTGASSSVAVDTANSRMDAYALDSTNCGVTALLGIGSATSGYIGATLDATNPNSFMGVGFYLVNDDGAGTITKLAGITIKNAGIAQSDSDENVFNAVTDTDFMTATGLNLYEDLAVAHFFEIAWDGNGVDIQVTRNGDSAKLTVENQAFIGSSTLTPNAIYIDRPVGWVSGTPRGLYLDDLTIETVPEPATMSLLALGGIAMLRRRKK